MVQGKTLRDLNRVTFEFEDPLLMALCFEVLNKKYNIHGLKNKYLQETFKESPNFHIENQRNFLDPCGRNLRWLS
ncbi:hypothetical protein TL16_g09197 [Triparma laevis f. inornata]|uniref:Uncharacterized protein n=2 Tax=Triparma laevis TaxID=1534972 RepID=A0A9W7EHG7_9STRA|nr:hypothetical protein TrLO_g9977 [Triparma laevis f. longispina]GMH82252.1 hypothetical protein TL16_g09197 [Triparma laevis f. inornata]